MDKKWIDKKRCIASLRYAKAKINVIKAIKDFDLLTPLDKEYIIEKVRVSTVDTDITDFQWLVFTVMNLNDRNGKYWFGDIERIFYNNLKFQEIANVVPCIKALEKVQDSEWVDFDGDIVITDPYYTAEDVEMLPDDSPLLYRSTLCSDWNWSCITYSTENTYNIFGENYKEKLGEFCSDYGTVCVDLLPNILERCPGFLEIGDHCRTIIRNFKGRVKFQVDELRQPEQDWDIDINNYEVRVVGEGINTVTGEKISFTTAVV